MANGGHVAGTVAFSEAGLVVAEGDVEHPVQAVSIPQWALTVAAASAAVKARDEMK